MPVFTWEAITKDGLRKRGEMEAPMRQNVVQELEKQQLLPVQVVSKPSRVRRSIFSRQGKIIAVDKILMCRHLAVMIRAGIAMSPSLTILYNDAEKPALRQFYAATQETIRRGQPLWAAFSTHGNVFPNYMIGLIRAGEASGQLAASFDQAADQLMRENDSRRRAIAAMLYPAILFIMSTLLVLFLFIFAIPRLAKAVESIGPNLPLFSKIVFGTSAFFSGHPLLVILLLLLLFGGGIALAVTRPGRQLVAAFAWKFPPSRSFLKKFAIARFSRTLGSLLKAGLPALEAVEITAGSVGIEQVRLAVLDARERIRRGSSFTDAFKGHSEYFPNLLTGMMAVGEQSGQLSDLLMTVSKFFEEDADRALQTLVALVEPLMLLAMGLIVGTIALSVILPIYQLVTSLQQ